MRDATSRFLLDTHAFIWLARAPHSLSPKALAVLSDPNSALYVSAVSLWEICLKQGRGKLDFGFVNAQQSLEEFDVEPLSITLAHVRLASSLPTSEQHKDPFDRLIIAQAIVEGVTLISKDKAMRNYHDLKLLW